jgi:sulfatase maturation enzyme AslB (radical SAM superfamily)
VEISLPVTTPVKVGHMDSVNFVKPDNVNAIYDPDRDQVFLRNDGRPRLLSVCFEPTNRCPGKCPYCLIENHDPDWSTRTLKSVLDVLVEHGTMRFGFGGGEPLLRSDIVELGSHVRRRGGGALLRSSGMFPMIASDMGESFDWVDLSFDSIDAEVFRRCRPGVPYDILVNNLLALVRSEARVRVSILITARNLHTVDATVRWLAETGVRQVRLQRLVRRGRAKTTWRSLSVPTGTVDTVIEDMVALGGNLGVDVRELRTVSTTTLCIVKGDGRFYSGEPFGSVYRGSVFDLTELNEVATQLFSAQRNAYANA